MHEKLGHSMNNGFIFKKINKKENIKERKRSWGPFRIFFSLLCFNFIYLFKYESIVHWVPQFFMHNKLVLWAACVLCSNYRKSHAKLAFVIPAGLLPCVYVTESALRLPRSHKNGVISLMEFQEVSVYAIRRCWHFHKFSWEP